MAVWSNAHERDQFYARNLMQLSNESPRSRWLVLLGIWLLAAGLLFAHAHIVRQYVAIVGQLGMRGAPTVATPLQQAYPAFAADAQTWVRHSLSLLEGNDLRLRYTHIDNAPQGREVHWNSGWAWLIAWSGKFNHWLNGVPMPRAVEAAALWVNPVVLTVLMIVLSLTAARRAGVVAGAIVAFAVVGHPRIFEGFFPGYVDHHGLIAIAAFGVVLGAVFMGGGWWREAGPGGGVLLPRSRQQAREGAVVSALSGAFGMWVTAASTIPPIAFVGVAGLITLILRAKSTREGGAEFDGDAWRTWGRVGGCASLFFYLVEYFPSHMGFRLESNHPFYGLAWWGGSELIAEFGERWLGSSDQRWRNSKRLIAPLAAVVVAPLTILIGGAKVFAVSDPFLARLHHDYIQEFLPLWRSLAGVGWKTSTQIVGLENVPLLVGIGSLMVLGRRAPFLLWFTTFITFMLTAMAWIQSRWLLNASGAQVCMVLVLSAVFFENRRPLIRWLVPIIAGLVLFFPHAVLRVVSGQDDVTARRVSPKDAQCALARDIAASILQSQPQGGVTLLTSPNFSTSVGYYGRFKTLGTLYWENTAGLKSAAAMLSAQTPDEAAKLIKQYGVTHIAMISEENFIEQYFRLLNPAATPEQVKNCFGHQLLFSRVIPPWLRMLPYKAPADLDVLNVTVMLFKVAFEQTPADALYHIGLAKVAMGNVAEAEADFLTLIRQSPDSYQPYLRYGELLYAKQDWEGAMKLTIEGIKRAPETNRMDLFGNAAGSFYRDRRYAQTIQIYRAALAEKFDPELAAYLAFVLSTAKDDSLRNGREALELASKALEANPNSPTLLNSYAVALAENGRFTDAATAASRALANAKLGGDVAAQRVSEQRLAAFTANTRWRE